MPKVKVGILAERIRRIGSEGWKKIDSYVEAQADKPSEPDPRIRLSHIEGFVLSLHECSIALKRKTTVSASYIVGKGYAEFYRSDECDGDSSEYFVEILKQETKIIVDDGPYFDEKWAFERELEINPMAGRPSEEISAYREDNPPISSLYIKLERALSSRFGLDKIPLHKGAIKKLEEILQTI